MEMTNVFDAVFHHDETVDTATEGKPSVDIRINPGCFEDMWMDHAATEELDPALLATDMAALTITERTAE